MNSDILQKLSDDLVAGKYTDVIEQCNRLIAFQPENGRVLCALGLALYCVGNYIDAAENLEKSLAKLPDDIGVRYNLAATHDVLKNFDRSLELYESILSIQPDHVNALYNMAVICSEHRQFKDRFNIDDAIQMYKRILESDPGHVAARNNLGLSLVRKGLFTEGIDHLNYVLSLVPDHAYALKNLLDARCYATPCTLWLNIADEILSNTALLAEDRYMAYIYKAIAAWIVGDYSLCRAAIQAAVSLQVPISGYIYNMQRYQEYIFALVNEGCVGDTSSDSAQAVMIGDSHCLSFARKSIFYQNVRYNLLPDLLMGAKAWHIAQEQGNKYIESLHLKLRELPAGSVVFCSFGEIDCRIDDGIMPYWQRIGGEISDVISQQVDKYVSCMAGLKQKYNLNIVLMSVVAPLLVSGDRREVVRLYNHSLRVYAEQYGVGFYDALYKATLDDNGYGRLDLYIDAFHLKPAAIDLFGSL